MAVGSIDAIRTLSSTLRARMKEAQQLQDKLAAAGDLAAASDLEGTVVVRRLCHDGRAGLYSGERSESRVTNHCCV